MCLLTDAENEASVAATEVQQADMKLKHATGAQYLDMDAPSPPNCQLSLTI